MESLALRATDELSADSRISDDTWTGLHRHLSPAQIIELMFVVGNTLPALALDKMGRKRTMMIGCGFLSFCMLMISILLSFNKEKTSTASIAFFFLYMLIFGATVNVGFYDSTPNLLQH